MRNIPKHDVLMYTSPYHNKVPSESIFIYTIQDPFRDKILKYNFFVL